MSPANNGAADYCARVRDQCQTRWPPAQTRGVVTYLANPEHGAFRAYRALGVDGLVNPVVPREVDQIRTASVLEETFAAIEPEALLEYARSLPESEANVLATFDRAKCDNDIRRHFDSLRRSWPGIELRNTPGPQRRQLVR